LVKTSNKDFNEQIEPAILLLDALMQKWTLNAAELVLYLLQNKKEEEIAGLLNISQSAVNQRKKNAQWFAVEKLIQYFEKTIQSWE
jgi:DNA-directed RNA polymerase specialized sigma subunit